MKFLLKILCLLTYVLSCDLILAAESTKHLNVYTKPVPPFILADKDEGFSIDLLNALTNKLGYTYTLNRVSSVNDLLDAVNTGKADLGIAAITINAAREKIIDFSQPIFDGGLQILVPINSGSAGLDFETIVSLLKVIGYLIIALIISGHLVWLLERKDNKDFHEKYLPGVWDGFWWSAVTITTVGYGDKAPKHVPGKIIGLIWMFSGFFLVAFFTSSITSVLTVQRLKGNINSLSDLHNDFVGTVEKTAPEQYLKSVGLSTISYPSIAKAYEGLERKEVSAIVFDAPILQYYANTEGKDKVKLVGKPFKKESYGISFPKHSPHLEEFNVALLSLVEDGTYEKIHNKWFGATEE